MKASARKTTIPPRVQVARNQQHKRRPFPTTAHNPRRRFLSLAAGAAALPAMSRCAWAQAYPSRPVRLVVGFPAGGAQDIYARLIAEWLSNRFSRSFIVENRPGAASNIATEAVARAVADGYTLLVLGTTNTINATLYDNLRFDFIRDIAPVAGMVNSPFVMLVNPRFPAKTVPEFIAHAKANPGKINMASVGTGNTTHVCGELFKMMTGVDMVHVPYRDLPYSDLIAGRVQVYFSPISPSIGYITSGTLRGLAVTAKSRVDALPDIPTMADFIPGFEAIGWVGVGAPKKTPAEIIDKLNKEINAGLADPKMKARLADLGVLPVSLTPAEYGRFIANETEKWGKVIRAANIKPE
jgi:tripartite-type tricarboxylate transporter receptor subunit TctC